MSQLQQSLASVWKASTKDKSDDDIEDTLVDHFGGIELSTSDQLNLSDQLSHFGVDRRFHLTTPEAKFFQDRQIELMFATKVVSVLREK